MARKKNDTQLPIKREDAPDKGKSGPKSKDTRDLLADQCWEWHCKRYPHAIIARDLGLNRATVAKYIRGRMEEIKGFRKEKGMRDLETMLGQQDAAISEAWSQMQQTERSLQMDRETRADYNNWRASENNRLISIGQPEKVKGLIPEIDPDKQITWSRSKADLIKAMNQSNELWGKALGLFEKKGDVSDVDAKISEVQEMMMTPITINIPEPHDIPPEFLEGEGDGIPTATNDFTPQKQLEGPKEQTADEIMTELLAEVQRDAKRGRV